MSSRQDFQRAYTRAKLRELFYNVFYGIPPDMFALDEVIKAVGVKGMVYRGVQSIPVKNIVGSENRYRDFDNEFLPKQDSTRERWESINNAYKKLENLPPILVYKIGDYYFVRDGNHRVSVAKTLGKEYIDAEVIELLTTVPLEKLDIKNLLLADGYRYFLEETKFNEVFPDKTIKLTHPWSYVILVEHINTYKYFLSQKLGREVSMEEAVRSWYENLFSKALEIIKRSGLMELFPEKTPEDLYIWLMDHWHYLKQELGREDVSIYDAVRSFKRWAEKQRDFFKRIVEGIKKIFSRGS